MTSVYKWELLKLLAQKRTAEAMEVFELNAQLHPDVWPVHVGLARGHAALGHRKEALEHAKLALAQAPDEANRRNLETVQRYAHQQGMIKKMLPLDELFADTDLGDAGGPDGI